MPRLRASAELGLVDIIWLERCPLLAPLRALPEYPAVHEIVARNALAVRRAFGLEPEGSLP
jgi:hypothetical protein